MSKSTWEEKIAALEEQLSQCSNKVKKCDTPCMTPQIAICIAAPVLLFLALYFLRPSFVMRSDGGKPQRNTKKVFLYTLLFTAIVWAAVYGYSRLTSA